MTVLDVDVRTVVVDCVEAELEFDVDVDVDVVVGSVDVDVVVFMRPDLKPAKLRMSVIP